MFTKNNFRGPLLVLVMMEYKVYLTNHTGIIEEHELWSNR